MQLTDRRTLIVLALGSLSLFAVVFPSATADARSKAERKLPERYQRSPYSLMSLSVGHPNHGFQVRAKKLRPRPYLKIKSGSRGENYGHPALVLMLKRSARDIARAVPGSVMLVGDLSSKRGGPLAGHHSHQSGRDADVAFYAKDKNGRVVSLKKFVAFGADGKAKDGSGLVFDDYRNYLLVQSWVHDKRAGLSHIFISRGLRARLLAYGKKRDEFRPHAAQVARLLKQPENAEPHDDHFHVRVSCPERQKGLCKEQSR